jgi:two-component system sensor histidine kinase YesM
MNFKSMFRRPATVRLGSKLIIAYLLLTVIPMSLLGYLSYYQYTKSLKQQFAEYLPGYLSLASRNIEKQLDEILNMTELIYSSNDIVKILRKRSTQAINRSEQQQDRFVVNGYLTRTYINVNQPDIAGVFVVANGELFHSTRIGISNPDLQAIRDLAATGQSFSERHRNAVMILPGEMDVQFEGSPPFLLIMKPIPDFDNRRNLGTMFIAVKLSFIHDILLEIENKFGANVSVMNAKGRIIYHNNERMIGLIEDEIGRYPIYNGSFQADSANDSNIISVHKMSEFGWVLAHSIPLKALTERTDLVKNVTIFIFIIFVAISSILSIVVALNVTRPIKRLSALMKHVERGNFNVDLQLKTRDEIGLLARSFNSMVAKIRDLIEKNYFIEIKQREAELYALQAQINPHFMYNTLETIGAAVEEDESETVVEMVTLLGRMLRFSLNNESKFVRIFEEVQHVHDYLTIQTFRFEERVRFTIQANIVTEEWYCPKFILQPLVENAIKYGLEYRKGVHIHINVSKEFGAGSGTDDIVFRIRDDGPGIDVERLTQLRAILKGGQMVQGVTGVGLKNVHSRIGILFGDNYGLQLDSTEGKGTEIIIRIPPIATGDGDPRLTIVGREERYVANHQNDDRG